MEACLSKLDGVRSARVRGLDPQSKFYFNLKISERASVLPDTIRNMLAELKKSSKGEEDYGYNSLEVTSIRGTVERSGEAWTFVARGSNQKYDLVPNEAVRNLAAAGKTRIALAGKVSDDGGRPRIVSSEAKEPAN